MAPKNAKTRPKERKYRLEFSLPSIFFWSLGLFVLLAWIFVLGILVGRGFLPEGVSTLRELKGQIAKLQEMVKRKDTSVLDQIKKGEEDPKYDFYKELSAKKEEAAKRGHTPVKKPVTPVRSKEKDDRQDKTPKSVGVYALQIASLESETKAAEMVNRLKDRGYPAYTYKAIVKGKPYYRVRCGVFRNKQEAIDFKNLLSKREHIDGFVARVEE